jgi:hypothetical protein
MSSIINEKLNRLFVWIAGSWGVGNAGAVVEEHTTAASCFYLQRRQTQKK